MSELAESLAEAATNAVDRAEAEVYAGRRLTRADLRYMAGFAVAAVLETLAAHCDPVSVGDGSTSQALLANTELRRLAAEVKTKEGD